MLSIRRWTWNFLSSTTRIRSLSSHGSENRCMILSSITSIMSSKKKGLMVFIKILKSTFSHNNDNIDSLLWSWYDHRMIVAILDGSKNYPMSAWCEDLFQKNPNLGHKIHVFSQLISGPTPYNVTEKVLETKLYSLAFCNKLMGMRRWMGRSLTACLATIVIKLGFHIFRIMRTFWLLEIVVTAVWINFAVKAYCYSSVDFCYRDSIE